MAQPVLAGEVPDRPRGHVRYYHFGEGEYAKTEEAIRTLLGDRTRPAASGLADESPHGRVTPESYLGYERLARYAATRSSEDEPHAYTFPPRLAENELAYGGRWTVEDERAVAGRGARLRLHYRARDVYLVLTGQRRGRRARRREARADGARAAATGSTRSSSGRSSATTCSSCASRRASRPTRSRSVRVAAVYAAAPDRYERMQYRRSGRSGLQLPASRSGSGTTSATTGRTSSAARSCAAPSISASSTSTSRTTTGRRTAPPRRTSAASCATTSAPTATSSSSRRRPATTCGRGRTASGARASTCSRASTSRSRGWASTTSTSSTRTASIPETPLEETIGALDTAVRQGKALYAGISSYSAAEDARGGGDRARPRHADRDPPAVVLDAEPLDRAGAARRARATRASAASPSRRSRRGC